MREVEIRSFRLGGVVAALALATALPTPAQEGSGTDDVQEPAFAPRYTGSVETAPGILPQLGVLLRLPDGLQLRNPNAPTPPEEPISYTRVFPLLGEQTINRGYALPLPVGVTLRRSRSEQLGRSGRDGPLPALPIETNSPAWHPQTGRWCITRNSS